MKTTTVLSIFLGLLLASTTVSAAQKFFKWTDEKGVTHYSEAPPEDPKTKTSAVKVQTKLPSGSLSKSEDKKDNEKKPSKSSEAATKSDIKTPATATEKTADKYAEKCKKLNANLKSMQEHPRVRVTNDKGESRILSQEEKDSQTDDIQREIKAFCQ